MKRKAAWAAAGMIPAFIAANWMPRFVLYAFCAILVITVAVLAVFRYRGRLVRPFFILASACIACLVFLVHYESVTAPIRKYNHKTISAQVVFINEDSDYWTVRIKNAYRHDEKTRLSGTFGVSVYDVTIEPYDVADVEFVLNGNDDNDYKTFEVSDFVIHEVRHSQFCIEKSLSQFRRQIITLIQTRIGGEEGNLTAAFLTGDKTDLSSIVLLNFQKAGLSHVMAVSGLHLSIFLGMLSYVLDKTAVNRKITSAASLFLIGIVAVLADFSISVLRAGIMCVISLVGYLWNRRDDSLNSLALSMMLIALFSPFSVLDVSYLLSGAATAGILILSPILEDRIMKRMVLGRFLRSQLSLVCVSVSSAVFTAPILIIYFRELSVLSVPAMSIVNYPVTLVLIGTVLFCCLFWVPFLGEFIAYLLHMIAQLILNITDLLGAFEQATISFHSLPMIVCAILIGLLFLLLYLLRQKRKCLRVISGTMIGLIVLSLTASQFYSHAFSRLIVLGNSGECNIFMDHGKAIVVNCGNAYLALQAQEILKEHGFEKIDLLLLTGIDRKLSDGIPSLLSYIPARQMLLSDKEKQDEFYCRAIDAANRVRTQITHYSQDKQIFVENIPISLYDFGEHNNHFSAIIDPQQKAIGFFPAVDRQTLIHAAALPHGQLHVNTLITGTCTSPDFIDTPLFYLTDPQTVILQMAGQKLTNREILALVSCGAEYTEINSDHPQHMIDYKIG